MKKLSEAFSKNSLKKSKGNGTLKEKNSMRLAKRIASISALSRRQAEEAIKQGRVQVEGIIITTPAFCVTEEQPLQLDGHPLEAAPIPQLWMLYKPRGCLVTRSDPQGRPTVFTECALPPSLRHITVGRLDYESEGLLLITNTPSLAHQYERSSWKRCYRVWISPSDAFRISWDALEKGVCIEGIFYKPCTIVVEKEDRLLVTLTEGKKREVRVLLAFAGVRVTRLLRLSFGPFQLGRLPVGRWKSVPLT